MTDDDRDVILIVLPPPVPTDHPPLAAGEKNVLRHSFQPGGRDADRICILIKGVQGTQSGQYGNDLSTTIRFRQWRQLELDTVEGVVASPKMLPAVAPSASRVSGGFPLVVMGFRERPTALPTAPLARLFMRQRRVTTIRIRHAGGVVASRFFLPFAKTDAICRAQRQKAPRGDF